MGSDCDRPKAVPTGKYDVVFDRAERVDGLRVVALSLTAVDLLSGRAAIQ
jgi:hypothetical protein